MEQSRRNRSVSESPSNMSTKKKNKKSPEEVVEALTKRSKRIVRVIATFDKFDVSGDEDLEKNVVSAVQLLGRYKRLLDRKIERLSE